MKEEQNNIDQLFREKLASRSVALQAEDWTQFEKLLDERKGGGYFKWIALLLLTLLVAGIGATVFTLSNKEETQPGFSNTDQPSQHGTAVYSSIPELHEYNKQDIDQTSTTQSSANEVLSTSGQATVKESEGKMDEAESHTNSLTTTSSSQSGEIQEKKDVVIYDAKISTRDFSMDKKQGKSKKQKSTLLKNDLSPSASINTMSSGFADEGGLLAFHSESENKSAMKERYPLVFLQSLDGCFDITEPLLNHHLPLLPVIAGPWSLQFSMLAGKVSSSFSGDDNLKDYLAARNQSETGAMDYGFEISLARTAGRERFSIGLEYARNGENISYSDESEITVTELDTTWSHYSHTISYIDSIQSSNGVFGMDSITITANIWEDSMAVSSTSHQQLIHNAELSAHNGITTLEHIIVPVRYGHKIARLGKNGRIYLNGTAEFDYLLVRNAYYLAPAQDRVDKADAFGTYRRFMVNGTVGIEYDHSFAADRCYFIFQPYLRKNLMSWNSNFDHRYVGYGIRFGVGVRLK